MSHQLNPFFESFPDVHEMYRELLSQGYTVDKGVSWRRNKSEAFEAITISFRKDGEVVRISQELDLATRIFSELFFETL